MYPFAYASTLSDHLDNSVTILAKVISVDDTGKAEVDSSGPITVHTVSSFGEVLPDNYYRFMGKVVDDKTLRAHDQHLITNVGDYDPETAKRVIDAISGTAPFN